MTYVNIFKFQIINYLGKLTLMDIKSMQVGK